MIRLEIPITTVPARFLQYRLTLTAAAEASPVVDKVEIAYVLPNLKPRIELIQTKYPGSTGRSSAGSSGSSSTGTSSKSAVGREPKHATQLNVTWKAKDPNADRLTYKLEFRPTQLDKWLPLADELSATKHTWRTRRVPDGWYLLRLIASDRADNTPDMARTATRNSDPVLVDNTPPTLLRSTQIEIGPGSVMLTFTVTDELSSISGVHWTVDGEDDWHPAVCDDLIYDSTSEDLKIIITDVAPGLHVVTLRITDARGNAFYKAELIEIKDIQSNRRQLHLHSDVEP